MKKMMKTVGRFMYCTWYGAAVVFVAVAAVLCGLQFANYGLGDIVPWPKDVHLAIMLAAVANIGVAMIATLCRRKWARAFGQLTLAAFAYICLTFVGFISYCVPTRMSTPPSREWTEANICQQTAIAFENLAFLGGVSQRENIVVYEVAENATLGNSRFFAGSPWMGGEIGDRAITHYRTIMTACRIDATLPKKTSLSYCDSKVGKITLVVADGRIYLVYERM